MRAITDLYYTINDNGTYNYYEKANAPKGARMTSYRTAKTVKVIQADGSIKVGYMYGEKQWSYDAVEVEQYRAEQKKAREQKAKRNKMLAEIMKHFDAMSDEELKKVLQAIDK
jgi:hypothetical protein